MKKIIVLLFLAHTLYAQNPQLIHINPTKITPVVLSDIAQEVTPVFLKEIPSGMQFVHLTKKYLFVCGMDSLYQYDHSGRLIKKAACGMISGITSNPANEEIYISSSKNKIVCFDYSLETKKEYTLQSSPSSLFFYENKLLVQTNKFQNDTLYYYLSRLDLFSGKEIYYPFEPIRERSSDPTNILFVMPTLFSVYKNKIIFSWAHTSNLYEIKEDKVIPFITWKPDPEGEYIYENSPFTGRGISKNFLIINYNIKSPNQRRDQIYVYVKNMKTEKEYNNKATHDNNGILKGCIKDDIYQTGYFDYNKIINSSGDFYFIKSKEELEKESSPIQTDKGAVIFIVKVKE